MEILIFIKITILSAFTIQLITITGIRGTLQIYAPKLISRLFSCDFCLSFWISVFITLIYCIWMNDFSCIFIPLLSTPITRKLL